MLNLGTTLALGQHLLTWWEHKGHEFPDTGTGSGSAQNNSFASWRTEPGTPNVQGSRLCNERLLYFSAEYPSLTQGMPFIHSFTKYARVTRKTLCWLLGYKNEMARGSLSKSSQTCKWDKVAHINLGDVYCKQGKSQASWEREEGGFKSAWGSQGRLLEETARLQDVMENQKLVW